MLRIRSQTYSYPINLTRDWPGSRCALHANQNVNKEKYGKFKTNTQSHRHKAFHMHECEYSRGASHHRCGITFLITPNRIVRKLQILLFSYGNIFRHFNWCAMRVCVCVCLVSFRFPFGCEYFSLNFIVRSSFPAHYSSGFDIYSLA